MSFTHPYGKYHKPCSCYTNNFNQQEITFANSDYVVLISKAEEDYYKQFGYDMFDTKTCVIYNSYQPKYDKQSLEVNYSSNTLGYIGRTFQEVLSYQLYQ